MTGITRRPVFWIAYAVLALMCLALALAAVPAGDSAGQPRHQARAARRRRRGAGAREGAQPRRVRTARRRRAFATTRARRTTSSWKAAASRPSRRWSRATSTRPTGGKCGCSSPASSRKRSCASVPTARVDGFSRRVPETYVRDAATKALDPRPRSRWRERARTTTGMSTSAPTTCSSSRRKRSPPAASTTSSCSSATSASPAPASACESTSPATS